MATTSQRALIHNLMEAAEFALDVVTLLHSRLPHCGRERAGQRVDVWIDSLSKAQASEVIGFLQREVA